MRWISCQVETPKPTNLQKTLDSDPHLHIMNAYLKYYKIVSLPLRLFAVLALGRTTGFGTAKW
jgi:hypothetical protein